MKKLIFIAISCLIALAGCKPTEKGYKAAYDAALGKREAVKADIDVDLPEGALQQVDGPQLKEIDGVRVYIMNQRIKPIEEGKSLPGNYNVAVGTYKMVTNSKAQSSALSNEGYDAFVAETSDGIYYTVIGSFDNLSDAVTLYQKYSKGKDRVYVGLPDAPVIIYSNK